MERAIYNRMTPGRRRLLEALSDGQPRVVPGRGRAGYDCRILGWAKFAVREISTGRVLPGSPGPHYNKDGVHLYEFLSGPLSGAMMITPEGLVALEKDRAIDAALASMATPA